MLHNYNLDMPLVTCWYCGKEMSLQESDCCPHCQKFSMNEILFIVIVVLILIGLIVFNYNSEHSILIILKIWYYGF